MSVILSTVQNMPAFGDGERLFVIACLVLGAVIAIPHANATIPIRLLYHDYFTFFKAAHAALRRPVNVYLLERSRRTTRQTRASDDW
jgi:hypothetical protein